MTKEMPTAPLAYAEAVNAAGPEHFEALVDMAREAQRLLTENEKLSAALRNSRQYIVFAIHDCQRHLPVQGKMGDALRIANNSLTQLDAALNEDPKCAT